MTTAASRRLFVALLVILALVVAGLWAAFLPTPTPDTARALVADLGWWAPVLAVLAYVVAAQFMAPTSVLNLMCGAGFGFVPGLVIAYVGACLSAALNFFLARRLPQYADAPSSTKRPPQGTLGAMAAWVARFPVLSVMIIRCIGVAPFGPTNIALAFSPISPRAFLAGTAIGVIPGTIANVTVGAYSVSPTSWQLWAGVGSMIGLAVLGSWWGRRHSKQVF